MCDVDEEAVVSAADAPSIYDIPKVLHSEGLDAYVVRRLGLPFRDVDWSDWDELLRRVHRPARSVTIALVGKYVDLPDAYLSPAEALRAGGFGNDARVNIRWVTSDDCQTPEGAARQLDGVDGVLVPGGFGVRGIEGKIGAVRYARENGIPLLGLCLGLQCMAIEVGAGPGRAWTGANSAEFDPDAAAPGDRHHGRPGGRGGRGAGHGRHDAARACTRPCSPRAAWSASCTATDVVEERHRHRYEVNNAYRDDPGAGRAGLLRAVARRPAGRVRRAAAQRPPVLRGHPGASGVPVPADPAAPAVQRAGGRGARALAGRSAPPIR